MVTPMPPKIMMAFLAAPSDHPLLTRKPDTAPSEKFPRSAAMNGTHTAINPVLSSIPFATRKMGNQSVTKNQTGSVSSWRQSFPMSEEA